MIEPNHKQIDYPDLSISSEETDSKWWNIKKKFKGIIEILNSSVAVTLLTLINVFAMSRYFD